MTWSTSQDPEQFNAAAGDFLRSQPVRNTVALSVAESLRAAGPQLYGDEPPLLGWWREPGGQVTGACVQTPPYPLLLTGAPEQAVRALADELAAAGRPLRAVNGSGRVAALFAAEWQRRAGAAFSVRRRMRLYRLAGLIPPQPAPPGRARVAGPADRELLAEWLPAAELEMGEPKTGPVAPRVDLRLSYGGLTLWETGGTAVSFAGLTRQLAGVVRVGPVYTPPALRRRGYAAGVTAAVSRAALDAGAAEVLLFTDLANPTSNGIYQRLGYEPIEDRVILAFAS
jgi:hypothetical protein